MKILFPALLLMTSSPMLFGAIITDASVNISAPPGQGTSCMQTSAGTLVTCTVTGTGNNGAMAQASGSSGSNTANVQASEGFRGSYDAAALAHAGFSGLFAVSGTGMGTLLGHYQYSISSISDQGACPGVSVTIIQGNVSTGIPGPCSGGILSSSGIFDVTSAFNAGTAFPYSVQLSAIASSPGSETSNGSVTFLGFAGVTFNTPEPALTFGVIACLLGLVLASRRRKPA